MSCNFCGNHVTNRLSQSISDETATDEHKRTSTEGIAATSFPEMTLAEYKYMRDDLREALYKELEVEARKELTAHFASNGFAGSSAFQAFINSKAEHEHQVLWNGVRQRVKNGRKRADSNELHQRTWDVEEVRKRAFKDGQNDAYNNFTNKVLICLILTFFATACFVLFIYTLANLSVAVYHGTSLIEKLFKKFLVKFLMKFLAWWGKLIMGRTSILALFT